MYSAGLALSWSVPSSSLIPSRNAVLPAPLGPVATLIPSTASGMVSGRNGPHHTNWTSSTCGIGLLLCVSALDEALEKEAPHHLVCPQVHLHRVDRHQVVPGEQTAA